MGVSADGSSKAFRKDDIESMFIRVADRISYNPRNPRENCDHFFVAVDPCGGGSSSFAVCSVVVLPGGQMQARLYSANVFSCPHFVHDHG